MKIEMIDNNTLVVEDGMMVLTTDGYGSYTMSASGVEVTGAGGSMAGMAPQNQYDNYPYISSVRGLTVAESTERAAGRVYHEIWDQFNAQDIGDVNLLRDTIRTMIAEQQGRQAVYALAGYIKKQATNGYYEGVPLAWVMKGFVDGMIPREDGKPVFQGTPYNNRAVGMEEVLNRILNQ